ncbi:hypothetical protein BGZ98_003058, partial [Dissophora globulifera]
FSVAAQETPKAISEASVPAAPGMARDVKESLWNKKHHHQSRYHHHNKHKCKKACEFGEVQCEERCDSGFVLRTDTATALARARARATASTEDTATAMVTVTTTATATASTMVTVSATAIAIASASMEATVKATISQVFSALVFCDGALSGGGCATTATIIFNSKTVTAECTATDSSACAATAIILATTEVPTVATASTSTEAVVAVTTSAMATVTASTKVTASTTATATATASTEATDYATATATAFVAATATATAKCTGHSITRKDFLEAAASTVSTRESTARFSTMRSLRGVQAALILGTVVLGLVSDQLGTAPLGLDFVDELYKDTLVLGDVTFGLHVQDIVQMAVGFSRLAVLAEEAAENACDAFR